jgi:predicted nucleic acid-binding Zn ribbon protein
VLTTTDRDGAVTEKAVEPDTSAGTPQAPEALIEEARQRARRRRLWTVATVVLVVLGVVLGILASGGSGSGRARPRSSPSEGNRGGGPSATAKTSAKPVVDLTATPKGWVPVDYGNARVSVPSSWRLWGGCSEPFTDSEQGQVYLGGVSPIEKVVCPGVVNFAQMSLGAALATGSPTMVNGINVYSHGADVWERAEPRRGVVPLRSSCRARTRYPDLLAEVGSPRSRQRTLGAFIMASGEVRKPEHRLPFELQRRTCDFLGPLMYIPSECRDGCSSKSGFHHWSI